MKENSDNNKIRRKDHRLHFYDYSKSAYYFITINTYKRQHFFGEIKDNKMILNENGNIVDNISKNILDLEKAEFLCFQIMPNHIHFIIELKKDGNIELKNIISYFKSTVSKQIKDIKPLWDRGYFDRVIRDEKEYNNVVKYILDNPYRDKYKW